MLLPGDAASAQAMVDNATSAIAAKNASLGGRRSSPVAKPKANGRMEAISRRLAQRSK